jgi:hypothetical protein
MVRIRACRCWWLNDNPVKPEADGQHGRLFGLGLKLTAAKPVALSPAQCQAIRYQSGFVDWMMPGGRLAGMPFPLSLLAGQRFHPFARQS